MPATFRGTSPLTYLKVKGDIQPICEISATYLEGIRSVCGGYPQRTWRYPKHVWGYPLRVGIHSVFGEYPRRAWKVPAACFGVLAACFGGCHSIIRFLARVSAIIGELWSLHREWEWIDSRSRMRDLLLVNSPPGKRIEDFFFCSTHFGGRGYPVTLTDFREGSSCML